MNLFGGTTDVSNQPALVGLTLLLKSILLEKHIRKFDHNIALGETKSNDRHSLLCTSIVYYMPLDLTY